MPFEVFIVFLSDYWRSLRLLGKHFRRVSELLAKLRLMAVLIVIAAMSNPVSQGASNGDC